MDYAALSKEVSYALRHNPWEYGLDLDERGFVPISHLLSALNGKDLYEGEIVEQDLVEMINRSEKRRHEILNKRIRALYGHTTPERISREEGEPPATLYHGTARSSLDKILEEGLKPMGRQYVHLSADAETALRVGKRKDSKPALLAISALAAASDDVTFYVGNEKIWLADIVPPKYIEVL